MVVKLHGLHLCCDGAAQSEPGVSCSSGTGLYESQWAADGCGTELVLVVGQLQEKKKNSVKRELMTAPTRLRRASFIFDSDTLNPAYLEHSNKTKFYRISPVKLQVMKELVMEMLAENILKRSSSAWASLVVLMPKKKVGKPRVCVNYIKLKPKTHTDADLTTTYTRNPGPTC